MISKYILRTQSIQLALIICTFMLSPTLYAQTQDYQRMQMAEQEKPTSEYVHIPREDMDKSPGYRDIGSSYFTTQVNVTETGQNILMDAANEPSIAVDPNNPNRMMIGWRQFGTVFNSFRQAGYAYTLDGGLSWTFPEPIESDVFRSDPVLSVDNDGVFYYNSLTYDGFSEFTCDVFRTTSTGVVWDEGVDAAGGDKQWMAVDNTSGMGEGHVYTIWNESFSVCSPGAFVRSIDGGDSYEDCIVVPEDIYWGTLAVGPEGELYGVGRDAFGYNYVIKSITAKNPDSTVNWSTITEIDLGGKMGYGYEVNPAGLIGQAWIDVDKSGGPDHGNVYVLASVDRLEQGTAVDVMFTRSTDGGLSWDDPIKINTDLSWDDYQWFGTMSVAPNGRIDVIWLDTRDAFQLSISSALYYSFSEDGGVSWSVNEKLSELFDPRLGWPQQEKMGDYFHMVSDNGGAHLAWANTLNGEQDVYYTHIIPSTVGNKEIVEAQIHTFSAYPNPFRDQNRLSYQITKSAVVRLEVFDVYGTLVQSMVDGFQPVGSYTYDFLANDLAAGVYYARLQLGSETRTLRLMHIN